jgi:hypothetical protein
MTSTCFPKAKGHKSGTSERPLFVVILFTTPPPPPPPPPITTPRAGEREGGRGGSSHIIPIHQHVQVGCAADELTFTKCAGSSLPVHQRIEAFTQVHRPTRLPVPPRRSSAGHAASAERGPWCWGWQHSLKAPSLRNQGLQHRVPGFENEFGAGSMIECSRQDDRVWQME